MYLLLDYMSNRNSTTIIINGNGNGPVTVNNNNYWGLPFGMFTNAYQYVPKKEAVAETVIATLTSAFVQTNCLPTDQPPVFGNGNALAKFYLSDGFSIRDTISEGAHKTSSGSEYTWVQTYRKGQNPCLQVILEITDPTKINYITAGNTICKIYSDMDLSVESIIELLKRLEKLCLRYGENAHQRSYYATIIAGLCGQIPKGTSYKRPNI